MERTFDLPIPQTPDEEDDELRIVDRRGNTRCQFCYQKMPISLFAFHIVECFLKHANRPGDSREMCFYCGGDIERDSSLSPTASPVEPIVVPPNRIPMHQVQVPAPARSVPAIPAPAFTPAPTTTPGLQSRVFAPI